MNILGIFLINQIRTGGDRDYINLLEELANRGNKVFVIINTYLDYIPKSIIPIKLDVKYKRRHFPPASFLFKRSIKKKIRLIKDVFSDFPLDFIHIHGDIYLKAALFLVKKTGVPFFYASRCNDIDRAHILRTHRAYSCREYLFSLFYEPVNRYRENQIAKYSNLITFLNNNDKDRFLKRTGCDKAKTSVIPNHIGPPRCTEEFQNKNKSSCVKNIVYVGAISPSKGLWDLIKAAHIIRKEYGNYIHYYILGRLENSTSTIRLIQKLNLEDLFSIEGYKDPFPYFINHDLFIYPTLYDAFGNVVTESLHCGCPVIAAAVGGLPDLLHYPELLFEPGNVEEIALKIGRCINDTVYYNTIRKLCEDRAKEYYFDWAERFEKTMKDYLEKKI
jgi:glycosyltransferase involved in cell wall biosynthesis